MRPYIVGLTGGMGAGKSTVADCFARLGIAVVDTDIIARELTSAGGEAMPAISASFGLEFVDPDGGMNRAAMRALVFSDPLARKRLEDILHPLILRESEHRVMKADSPYVLLVVPLLAEHLQEYRDLVDRIAVVDCDESQQLLRVLSRPGMNIAQAKAMLATQSAPAERLAIADDVIDNRGDLMVLSEQVTSLHNQYMCTAKEKNPHFKTTHCHR